MTTSAWWHCAGLKAPTCVVTPVGTPLMVTLDQRTLARLETIPCSWSGEETVEARRGAAD